MLKMTGWKDIDDIIIRSSKLCEEGNELDKLIEQINKFSPKKTHKRTPRKIRLLTSKKRNVYS